MKAILMSIKPKWCEKIFSGEKTVEVRKVAPNLETPYKAYVYCTKARHKPNDWMYLLPNDRTLYFGANARDVSFVREEGDFRNGMVIGEFVCDRAEKYEHFIPYDVDDELQYSISQDSLISTCLEPYELTEYGNGKLLHGLHISAPKRYDKPKALSEFRKPDVWYKTETDNTSVLVHETGTMITRPPQSFMYVEEIEE